MNDLGIYQKIMSFIEQNGHIPYISMVNTIESQLAYEFLQHIDSFSSQQKQSIYSVCTAKQIEHQKKWMLCLEFYTTHHVFPSRYSKDNQERLLGEWLYRIRFNSARIADIQFQELQKIEDELENMEKRKKVQEIYQEFLTFYQSYHRTPKKIVRPDTEEEKLEYAFACKVRKYFKEYYDFLSLEQVEMLEAIHWFKGESSKKQEKGLKLLEREKIEYQQQLKTLHEIAKMEQIPYTTLSKYYKKTGNIEKAIFICTLVKKNVCIKTGNCSVRKTIKISSFHLRDFCRHFKGNYSLIQRKVSDFSNVEKEKRAQEAIAQFHLNGQTPAKYFRYQLGNISLKHFLLYFGVELDALHQIQKQYSVSFHQSLWIYLIQTKKRDFDCAWLFSSLLSFVHMDMQEMCATFEKMILKYKLNREECLYVKESISDYFHIQRNLQYMDWYFEPSLNRRYQKQKDYHFSKEDLVQACFVTFPFCNSILLPKNSLEFQTRNMIRYRVYQDFHIPNNEEVICDIPMFVEPQVRQRAKEVQMVLDDMHMLELLYQQEVIHEQDLVQRLLQIKHMYFYLVNSQQLITISSCTKIDSLEYQVYVENITKQYGLHPSKVMLLDDLKCRKK